MANDIGYDSKSALPNKLIQEDGTVTDITGKTVVGAVEAYENKPAMPNKFLNPDGSYSTLNQIIAEMVDTELFIIVDELPTTGESNKIYLLVVDDKLIEYVWVNDKWDPIGMVEFDLSNYYTKAEVTQLIAASLASAKEYADGKLTEAKNYAKNYTDTAISSIKIPQQVYRWDGSYGYKSTTPDLIAMFQEIYDVSRTQPVIIVHDTDSYGYGSSGRSCIYVISKRNSIANNAINLNPISNNNKLITQGESTNTIPNNSYYTLVLRFVSGTETLDQITKGDGSGGSPSFNFLATGVNYSTPYTPQYDGSPATKKYVDDLITTNITNVLNGSY